MTYMFTYVYFIRCHVFIALIIFIVFYDLYFMDYIEQIMVNKF